VAIEVCFVVVVTHLGYFKIESYIAWRRSVAWRGHSSKGLANTAERSHESVHLTVNNAFTLILKLQVLHELYEVRVSNAVIMLQDCTQTWARLNTSPPEQID
jgi:hypothetical protein